MFECTSTYLHLLPPSTSPHLVIYPLVLVGIRKDPFRLVHDVVCQGQISEQSLDGLQRASVV